MLDLTGRDRGFGESPLREEAIDCHLSRYLANNSDVYETLIHIETVLFSYRCQKRKEEEDKKKKDEQRKAKGKIPNTPSGGSRRGSYKEVVQRPTFRVK